MLLTLLSLKKAPLVGGEEELRLAPTLESRVDAWRRS